MTSQAPAALSALLRERTAAAHARAEQSPFLTALVAGRVGAAGYVALLRRLLPVYEALERAAAGWADDPRVGGFVQPALARAPRLRQDLTHLTGSPDAALTPASAAYAARVDDVARTRPASFLAHHYTRYLGDLSGGRIVLRAVTGTLGVGDGTGASHLHFPGLRTGRVKQEYRDRLDALPFTEAEREELVAESVAAFDLNAALAGELDAELGRWTTA